MNDRDAFDRLEDELLHMEGVAAALQSMERAQNRLAIDYLGSQLAEHCRIAREAFAEIFEAAHPPAKPFQQ